MGPPEETKGKRGRNGTTIASISPHILCPGIIWGVIGRDHPSSISKCNMLTSFSFFPILI